MLWGTLLPFVIFISYGTIAFRPISYAAKMVSAKMLVATVCMEKLLRTIAISCDDEDSFFFNFFF